MLIGYLSFFIRLFFFFQAEDGIRDYKVTGVQTCALPILVGRVEAVNLFDLEQRLARMELDLVLGAPASTRSRLIGGGKVRRQDLINFCRSEERRVGKECRYRWWPDR